jgi:GNAT superfamily N-acetyltransferase
MTLIRDISAAEVPLLLPGARCFFEEGRLPGQLNAESFVNGWRGMLASGVGVLLGAFDADGNICGAIGGSIFPDFQTNDLVATEFFWFALPDRRGQGLRLLRAFEQRAAERGAARIVMVHLEDLNAESMGKLYARLGYRLRERIYFKNLKGQT